MKRDFCYNFSATEFEQFEFLAYVFLLSCIYTNHTLLVRAKETKALTVLIAQFTPLLGLCFLPARRYASAGLCDSDVSVRPSVCLSVCLSVRLSHAGIVPSRAKAGS